MSQTLLFTLYRGYDFLAQQLRIALSYVDQKIHETVNRKES